MQTTANPQGADRQIAAWFVRRGVPSLLQGSGLPRLVGPRMVPALVCLYLAALTPFAAGGPWTTLIDIAFAVGSLLLTWVAANLVRRRPPFARVNLALLESALFVVVPALLSLAASPGLEQEDGAAQASRWEVFALSAAVQLTMLVVVWLLVGSGIWALIGWLSRELINGFERTGTTIARTVPMLIGVVTFFSFTAEVWQTLGPLSTGGYALLILLFTVVSGVFLSGHWHFDLSAATRFETRQELLEALEVPALRRAAGGIDLPARTHLAALQRFNLRLIVALSRLVVASWVAVSVFAFFTILLFLAVDAAVVKSWSQADPSVIWQWATDDRFFALT